MNSFDSKNGNNTPDDELGETLLAAVEAASQRQADEATIRRVIERAGQLATDSPVGSAEREPASLVSRRASASRKRIALVASWSGVAVAVTCLAVGLLVSSGSRLAFAQVQEQLAKVRTIRFVFRSTGPANQPPGRVFIIEPDRYREELPDGRVIVTDLRNKQVMELDTKAKTAEIYSLYGAADREQGSESISILRDAPGKSVETVGRRQLDGRDVIDYRVVDRDERTLKVTVDATAKLPVRIEWSSAGNANATGIVTDFVFDQPIDEALVRIVAPEGYQVTQVKAAARPEADELEVSSAGLGPVKWGMKTADVVKLLGQPDGIKPFETRVTINGKENPKRKKSGEELIYDSRGFRIIVDTDAGVESIDCYGAGQLGDRARRFAGRTDKGIRMSATPDEVSKAYGEPELRHGMTAELPNGRWDYLKEGLSFGFFDNRLSHIQVRGPHLRPEMAGVGRGR